ncbi:hypothetical protein MASR1M12_19930 [Erysipelotrichia bacterium]
MAATTTPFFQSDLKFVVADPHRPGHEAAYYPGEANVYTADAVVINKIDSANLKISITARENILAMNPTCQIIEAASPIFIDGWEKIRGKKLWSSKTARLLTHGEMTIGAGIAAAQLWRRRNRRP